MATSWFGAVTKAMEYGVVFADALEAMVPRDLRKGNREKSNGIKYTAVREANRNMAHSKPLLGRSMYPERKNFTLSMNYSYIADRAMNNKLLGRSLVLQLGVWTFDVPC